MAAYQLTLSAEADIIAIWQYTARHWGEEQAQAYHSELERWFSRLADAPHRDFETIASGLRSSRSGRHVVFWIARVDDIPETIAILPERMNLFAQLAHRLDPTQ